jgi:ribosome-associated protein
VELIYDVRGSAALSPLLRARALRRLDARLIDGTIVVVASEHRSQLRNRQAARERLAALLAEAIAPPPPRRRATRPSAGAARRRLADKTHRAALKRSRRTTED